MCIHTHTTWEWNISDDEENVELAFDMYGLAQECVENEMGDQWNL